MRRNPRHVPRIGPCFATASSMYWLHDGSNRQCPPSHMPTVPRYTPTTTKMHTLTARLAAFPLIPDP